MSRVINQSQKYGRVSSFQGKAFSPELSRIIDAAPKHFDKETFNAHHVKFKAGSEASKELLVRTNMRMVANRVLNSLSINPDSSVDGDQRFQEGCLGLLTALDKFDSESGNSFSTYATWWIDQHIMRALMNDTGNKPYRVPVHVLTHINVIKKFMRDYFKYGREDKVILSPTHITDTFVKAFNDWYADNYESKKYWSIETLEHLVQIEMTRGVVQAKGEMDDDDDPKDIYDFIESYNYGKFDSDVRAIERRGVERIIKAANLNEKQRLIFFSRIEGELTLDEIGKQIGITRERVRQIQGEAIEKLRRAASMLQTDANREIARLYPHLNKAEIKPLITKTAKETDEALEEHNKVTGGEFYDHLFDLNTLLNKGAKPIDCMGEYRKALIAGQRVMGRWGSIPSDQRRQLAKPMTRLAAKFRLEGMAKTTIANKLGFKTSYLMESAMKSADTYDYYVEKCGHVVSNKSIKDMNNANVVRTEKGKVKKVCPKSL